LAEIRAGFCRKMTGEINSGCKIFSWKGFLQDSPGISSENISKIFP
jgi:hypothetical protein